MRVFLEFILAPLLTFFVVQSIKLATDGIKGNFDLKNIFTTYGGMPSSHTAVVTSLTTMVGYTAGLDSPVFVVSLIFSIIVITDAMVLRHHMDAKGRAIVKLIHLLPSDQQNDFPKLAIKLEHSLPQVLVGASIGFIITFLINLI